MELENFKIGRMPPYLATSHVWAEDLFAIADLSNPGYARGMQLIAIVRLQHPELKSISYCWIDTWCIDQSDPDDKFRQIPRMGDVYRDAACVIVTTKTSFSFSQDRWDRSMKILERAFEIERLPGDEYMTNTDRINRWSLPVISAVFEAYRMHLELAAIPWAKRIWTAQEYILARSTVWIGNDERAMLIKPDDLTTLYRIFGTHSDILDMAKPYLQIQTDFENTTDMAEEFSSLNKLRTGKWPPIKSMLLARGRSCQFPADEVYGLMGAARISIEAELGDNLASAWLKFWRASIEQGTLFFVMLPVVDTVHERHDCGELFSCIMPSCSSRCRVGNLTLISHAKPWGESYCEDDSVSVLARFAGHCYIDQFLCEGDIPYDLDSLVEICGHDLKLALRVCRAANAGQLSRGEITTEAETIHAAYHLKHFGSTLDTEKRSNVQEMIDKFRTAPWHFSCHTKVYLGRVESSMTTTDCLIVSAEDVLEKPELSCLDLIEGYGQNHYIKHLMVVEKYMGKSTPLHKIAMLYPLFVHTDKAIPVNDCTCNGHAYKDELQRYTIDGSSCIGCHPRK